MGATQTSFIFGLFAEIPDFVGRLNHATEAIGTFLKLAGFSKSSQDLSLAVKFPQAYNKTYTFDLASMLTNESWRRFCWHYRQDYSCLQFSVPEQCKGYSRAKQVP